MGVRLGIQYMKRRDYLSGFALVVVSVSGCTVGSQRSVNLEISNNTDAEKSVHVTVGGTVIPEGEPPEGETKTPKGSDEIYFDQTLTVESGGSQEIPDIMQTADYPIHTGVNVDIQDGPKRREPVQIGPIGENRTIDITIHSDEISINTR